MTHQTMDGGGAGAAWRLLGYGALAVLVAGLFYVTWKSQFAASAGYLFGTPSPAVEAGYCLSVARQIQPGAPIGGYVDEARTFWIARLRAYGGDMGGAIAAGEAKLGKDLAAVPGRTRIWLMDAMEACSTRALMLGHRFRAFEQADARIIPGQGCKPLLESGRWL